MKIQVTGEVGREVKEYGFADKKSADSFEAKQRTYPAPGIEDGEHEAEIAYQGLGYSSKWAAISKDTFNRWKREHEFKIILGTRQIWKLTLKAK